MTNAEVWKHGEKQTLTAKEMQLFEKLYQNAGRIVTTGILWKRYAESFGRGMKAPFPPISGICGKKSKKTRQSRFPLSRSKGLAIASISRRCRHERSAAVFPPLYHFHHRDRSFLFLAVNIVLFFAILILGSMSGSDAVFPVETFSDHVSLQDGTWK